MQELSQKISENGLCAICGKDGKLSFEHVPPQSAFNNKPIYIQTGEHLFEDSKLHGKKKKSNKGFGSRTLCEPCNNNTGNWYAKDFAHFARQGMEIINKKELTSGVKGVYNLKPHNVFKQIITMFMSADKSGYLRSKNGLSEFILNKSSMEFPTDLKVFLYSNASPIKRMIGYSIIYDPLLGVQKWSEINFQPFGYFLVENSNPPNDYMIDITSWHSIKYGLECKMEMTTAYLKVSSAIIGTYG